MKDNVLILLCFVTMIAIIWRTYHNDILGRLKCACDQMTMTPEQSSTIVPPSTLIVVGLIRNGEQNVRNLIETIQSIVANSKYFDDWHLLAVENDSVDNTRTMLLQYPRKNVTVLGCGVNNHNPCRMNEPETTKAIESAQIRIDKMIRLRNIYMEYLATTPSLRSRSRYVLILDLDLTFKLDGIDKGVEYMESSADVDAVCAYGYNCVHTQYHDPFAHVEIDDTPCISKWHRRLKNAIVGVGVQPRRVLSCFGGATMYKLSSIVKKRYTKSPRDCVICEHVTFNVGLNIDIIPCMIIHVQHNPSRE